ncbi:GAF domain-containing protein [Prevotella intermedia]|jgi:GAF domain-containing protein A|uniref:GAF domain-containing protein n=1 Tax=Prevotella intermedia TaxID=28131 RepID=UPI000C1C1436|nr:GAF domain-containing protein [Prevotella intermedia]ATV28767.1 GAF domain-containing protein [Prevotella intermedia]
MNKKETYELLLKQIAALIEGEADNKVGVLANVAAAIHHTFDTFFWTGFYLLNKENTLQLGPFQGTPACYNIPVGKGVCGTAFAECRTLVVPDVEQFAGHIACSSLSRSEIVVPIYNKEGEAVGVLDIDSTQLNAFDDIDAQYLEQAMRILAAEIYANR